MLLEGVLGGTRDLIATVHHSAENQIELNEQDSDCDDARHAMYIQVKHPSIYLGARRGP